MGSGLLAGSTALVGFGIDSLIESSSGAILLWRLSDGDGGDSREGLALRLVGYSFLALALWVGWDAGKALLAREAPDESLVGIVLATLSAPEGSLITIQPWDASVISEIEKVILRSDLGLTPSSDGGEKSSSNEVSAVTRTRCPSTISVWAAMSMLCTGPSTVSSKMTLVDYVPAYRSVAGTGHGLTFGYWK